ncbi:hypothetical protein N480_05705 [Pseudoalteromonas luteoviolacea S2607]|uniref:hypothetical protein n=1 Tax=Pseudoalteromonas luteoviolacea TaxID=43657 RepID=UPI0007B03B21|nr:hypothetical protein [Pseudoalteromonas luteoviolacea]KZN30448.1 hypothetical protein N480_05705 [Pseudoalteromonas luteoviolacea S2607]
MFKKILKGLGFTLLVIIGLFTFALAWTSYKAASYEETAIPYMDKAIKDISTWQVDTVRSYLVVSTNDRVSESDLQALVKGLSKMGRLIEIGEFQFMNVSSTAMAGEASGSFVTYRVPAKYENGDGLITITLQEVDDSFQVYSFNLNSLALLK